MNCLINWDRDCLLMGLGLPFRPIQSSPPQILSKSQCRTTSQFPCVVALLYTPARATPLLAHFITFYCPGARRVALDRHDGHEANQGPRTGSSRAVTRVNGVRKAASVSS